ncbi:MAG: hypothetical protein HPY76_05755, partial [Anaerolineae bacterium]|nr:hypothetical protein [Anaerolineae bacterium]
APGRLAAILDMNRHRYDYLIDVEKYRSIEHLTVDLASVGQVYPQGTPGDSAGVLQMKDSGVSVRLGGVTSAGRIDLTLDNNDDYRISFWQGEDEVGFLVISGLNISEGLTRYTPAVPDSARQAGFDVIQVHPLRGDGFYALGHLTLAP